MHCVLRQVDLKHSCGEQWAALPRMWLSPLGPAYHAAVDFVDTSSSTRWWKMLDESTGKISNQKMSLLTTNYRHFTLSESHCIGEEWYTKP